MVILKNPESARQLGLLGAKATLVGGAADWPNLLHILAETVGAAGMVLFAFLTAWVFGREFADRTVRGLLQSPRRARPSSSRSWSSSPSGVARSRSGSWCSGWVLACSSVCLAGHRAWRSAPSAPRYSRSACASPCRRRRHSWLASDAGTSAARLDGARHGPRPNARRPRVGCLVPLGRAAARRGAAGPAGEAATGASVAVVVLAALLGLVATVVWWQRADQTG